MFIERGISINVTQVYDIGRIWVGQFYNDKNDGQSPWHDYYTVVATNNGVINSSVEFEDPNNAWLSGIRDIDVPGSFLNWIRSGTYVDMDDSNNNDYNMSSDKYTKGASKPWDPNENWETIGSRAWSTPLFATTTA